MTKQKAIKDSFWNILDYISTLAIFLITTKLLIEKIGVDGYGFYMFFTSLIGTFGLVDLGMGMAVSKYLSEFLHQEKIDEANQVITIALTFYLSIGLVLFLIAFLFSSQIINFLNFGSKYLEIDSKILLITSVIFIVNMVSTVMINTLVALEQWKRISLINIILKIVNAMVLIMILLQDIAIENKILFIFLFILFFSFVKLAIHFVYAKYCFQEMRLQKPEAFVKEKMTKFLKVSSMQYGLSLLGSHLDKFIISRFFGLEILGIYSFVVTAFVYLYGFLSNVFKIFLPKLSQLHGDKEVEGLKRSFKKLISYSFGISIVLALIGVIIWKPFISIYINEEFAVNSFGYMMVFMIFLVVRSAEPIFYYFFNAIAKPVVLVKNLLLSSSITISGYFIFVPIIGVYGLVTSQIIAILTVYLYSFYMIKTRGFYEFTK